MKFKVLPKGENIALQIIGEESFPNKTKAPKLIAEYLFSPEAATKVGNKLVESSLEMLEGARDLREFNELKEEDLNMEVEDDTE